MLNAEAKRQAEIDARAKLFANRNDRPASTDLTTLLGQDAPPTETELAAPTEAETPSEREQQPPIQRTKKAAPPPPWANANPKVKQDFTTRFPEELHLKLTWLKENLPNTSIQKLVKSMVEKEVEVMLRQHYPGYRKGE